MSHRRRLTGIALTATLVASAWTGTLAQRPNAVQATAQCPNLSGRYMIQGEDGQVNIQIDQDSCERIRIVRRSGYLGTITSEEHALTLDGKVRKDPMWFGGSDECCDTSAAFVSSTLTIEARATRGFTLTITYSLTAERDVLEEALINGRGQGPILAKRQN